MSRRDYLPSRGSQYPPGNSRYYEDATGNSDRDRRPSGSQYLPIRAPTQEDRSQYLVTERRPSEDPSSDRSRQSNRPRQLSLPRSRTDQIRRSSHASSSRPEQRLEDQMNRLQIGASPQPSRTRPHPLQRIIVARHGQRGGLIDSDSPDARWYRSRGYDVRTMVRNVDAPSTRDTPLTLQGEHEAQDTGRFIMDNLGAFQVVISSPYRRTTETARNIVMEQFHRNPRAALKINVFSGFSEIRSNPDRHGRPMNFTPAELEDIVRPQPEYGYRGVRQLPGIHDADYATPARGESEREWKQRARDSIDDVIRYFDQIPTVDTIVITTHADISAEISNHLLQRRDIDIGCPANISVFDRKEDRSWRAPTYNGRRLVQYCRHLHRHTGER